MDDNSLSVMIREARTSRGLTQMDVAEAMRAAGHQWHQQTVYKVERGDRSVTYIEGVDIQSVLGIDFATGVADTSNASRTFAVRALDDAIAKLQESRTLLG